MHLHHLSVDIYFISVAYFFLIHYGSLVRIHEFETFVSIFFVSAVPPTGDVLILDRMTFFFCMAQL